MERRDLREITAIEVKSFIPPWTEEMFIREMETRFSVPLVFHFEDKLVGYLCYWDVVDEAQLLNIAVHPQLRRSGFGETLMLHLESHCMDAGLQRIILEVARKNIAARALYRKCGYTAIGFRRNYYRITGDDALVMEKLLRSAETPLAAPVVNAS